jgi:hypothetical protein
MLPSLNRLGSGDWIRTYDKGFNRLRAFPNYVYQDFIHQVK